MIPYIEFPLKDCSSVILAGGKSSRIKTDKKNLDIGGSSLLDKAILNLSGKFRDTLISISEEFQEKKEGVRIIPDSHEGQGPLSGIYSGLRHSETEKNFVIAVDIPEISEDLILEMYRFTKNFDVVVSRWTSGKTEPLFGFYKKTALPVIRGNLDKRMNKVADIYRHVRCKFVPMKDSGWLFNINTEKDLRSYRKRLEKR